MMWPRRRLRLGRARALVFGEMRNCDEPAAGGLTGHPSVRGGSPWHRPRDPPPKGELSWAVRTDRDRTAVRTSACACRPGRAPDGSVWVSGTFELAGDRWSAEVDAPVLALKQKLPRF